MVNHKIITTPKRFSLKKGILIFPVANENFRSIEHRIDKIRDADFYLGVCGGGTQNIYLLSILSKNCSLKSIELVDLNVVALENFINISEAFNKSEDSLYYLSNIIKKYRQFKFKPKIIPYWRFFFGMFKYGSNGFEETNFRKVSLKKNILVKLKSGDILSYMKKENGKTGKYFVYLSNIFTYFTIKTIPRSVEYLLYLFWHYLHREKGYLKNGRISYIKSKLNPILNNKKFSEGSLVLIVIGFWAARTNYSALFEKRKNKFKLLAYKKEI